MTDGNRISLELDAEAMRALRRKDRPDIRLLIEHLQMLDASADDYADLLERVYSGEGLLATVLNIPGDDAKATRTEALAIGRWAQEFAQSPQHGRP